MDRVLYHRPLIGDIPLGEFTELQHRIDDRMRFVLGEYQLTPEYTAAYDLERGELFDRVDSLIGDTPLIHVENVGESTILAKVESQNPTENHYDRVFPRTIQKLEADGLIVPGDELLEITSGSGGRAFAWAARVLGYEARLVVPPELPKARLQDMLNFGATLDVSEPGYMKEASKAYVDQIAKLEGQGYEVTKHKTADYTVFVGRKEGERSVCLVNHSANELTVQGFEGIGEEIYQQMPPFEDVDYIVSVMGNGTSTTALSRAMRQHYPGVKVIGVEDERSPRYFVEKHPGEYERRFGHAPEFTQHDMFGSSAPDVPLKYGKVEVVDEVRLVNLDERNEAQDGYNQHRKSFEQIGNSSAASLVVARKLASENPGSNIVIVFYDKAGQYGDQLTLAPMSKFHYDRCRPEGVPVHGWMQARMGSLALLPRSISEAYRARTIVPKSID